MTTAPAPRRRRTIITPQSLPVEPAVERGSQFRVAGKLVAEDKSSSDPAKFDKPNMARVRVTGSSTVNMDNFNSVKCEVTIEMPCEPYEREIIDTYNQVSGLVDKLLNDELDIATGKPSRDQSKK